MFNLLLPDHLWPRSPSQERYTSLQNNYNFKKHSNKNNDDSKHTMIKMIIEINIGMLHMQELQLQVTSSSWIAEPNSKHLLY